MIRAVISDLGKVILWFNNTIFYRRMTAYCPHSEGEIREIVHRSAEFVELFDSGKITPREFYARAIQKLDARVSYEDFFAAYRDVFSLNRPALDVLIKLRGKYRLILLSNTDVVRFAYIKSKFPEILIFDEYVLSFEVGSMKPHPEIYREALKGEGWARRRRFLSMTWRKISGPLESWGSRVSFINRTPTSKKSCETAAFPSKFGDAFKIGDTISIFEFRLNK